jgi:peptide-methionine (S)-S-oxide reductase
LNKTVFDGKIVTELTEASEFYVAEEMHQNFYNQNNGSVGYCQVIIDPKLKKLRESFSDLLQEPAS